MVARLVWVEKVASSNLVYLIGIVDLGSKVVQHRGSIPLGSISLTQMSSAGI